MLELLIFLISTQIEVKQEIEVFPENIEYCQNVYMSGQNPLDQTCDFNQVQRSLFINF